VDEVIRELGAIRDDAQLLVDMLQALSLQQPSSGLVSALARLLKPARDGLIAARDALGQANLTGKRPDGTYVGVQMRT
jgi:hypothetical protein